MKKYVFGLGSAQVIVKFPSLLCGAKSTLALVCK